VRVWCVLGKKGGLSVSLISEVCGRLGARAGVRPASQCGEEWQKIAIVGSGPRDWRALATLSRWGTTYVFEALHGLGGVLVYGIRNFVCRRTSSRTKWKRCGGGRGVRANVVVGKTVTIDELFRKKDTTRPSLRPVQDCRVS
jgi:NADPH-dependent glutamate synthase beta subunit-like oxidoreductase